MLYIPNFIAKRPLYYYKTSKFYYAYLKTRKAFNRLGLRSGKSKRPTGLYRLYYLRKFFGWFYQLKTNYKIRRLFRFLRSYKVGMRYGYFLKLLYAVERFLFVTVWRLGFATNLLQSIALINSGFICVNGQVVQQTYYIIPIGGVVEFIYFYFCCFLKLGQHLIPFSLSPFHFLVTYFANRRAISFLRFRFRDPKSYKIARDLQSFSLNLVPVSKGNAIFCRDFF